MPRNKGFKDLTIPKYRKRKVPGPVRILFRGNQEIYVGFYPEWGTWKRYKNKEVAEKVLKLLRKKNRSFFEYKMEEYAGKEN